MENLYRLVFWNNIDAIYDTDIVYDDDEMARQDLPSQLRYSPDGVTTIELIRYETDDKPAKQLAVIEKQDIVSCETILDFDSKPLWQPFLPLKSKIIWFMLENVTDEILRMHLNDALMQLFANA